MGVARGVSINYNDFKQTYPNEWKIHNYSYEPAAFSEHDIYIAAPSFIFRIYADQGFFGYSELTATFYKWNGSNGFNYYGELMAYAQANYYAEREKKFFHNKNDETDRYGLYDDSDIHLWKIHIRGYSSGAGDIEQRYDWYLGTIGVIPDKSEYRHMWKRGSKLYACPIVKEGGISDTSFINRYSPEHYKGGLIDTSNAYMAYSVEE